MNSHPKTGSVLPTIVMAVGFLTWMLAQSHGCKLKSVWIEFPMLLGFLIAIPAWVWHASNLGSVVLRSLGAVVLMIGVQAGYLTWLHSDYFPQWLLFPKSRIQHRSPNKPAAGNAGFAPLLAIEHRWPGVPEPERPLGRFERVPP